MVGERRTGENGRVERNVFGFADSGDDHVAEQPEQPGLVGIDAVGMFGNPGVEGVLNPLLARRQLIQTQRGADERRLKIS